MTINVEKMRADMRWETRKFVLQAIVAIAASVGAGVALANWVNNRPVPASPPQIIYLQPGSPPAQPAAPPSPR